MEEQTHERKPLNTCLQFAKSPYQKEQDLRVACSNTVDHDILKKQHGELGWTLQYITLLVQVLQEEGLLFVSR